MINLNPKIWGPHGWFFIESVVIGLPDKIPLEIQNELKHFFISISFLLPCETCRQHFSEYIKSTDIMGVDFSTKIQVLTWINRVHNNIRKINRSKPINIEKTIQYYNSKYNIKTKTSYVDIFFLGIFIIGLVFLIKYLYFTPSVPDSGLIQVPNFTPRQNYVTALNFEGPIKVPNSGLIQVPSFSPRPV